MLSKNGYKQKGNVNISLLHSQKNGALVKPQRASQVPPWVRRLERLQEWELPQKQQAEARCCCQMEPQGVVPASNLIDCPCPREPLKSECITRVQHNKPRTSFCHIGRIAAAAAAAAGAAAHAALVGASYATSVNTCAVVNVVPFATSGACPGATVCPHAAACAEENTPAATANACERK